METGTWEIVAAMGTLAVSMLGTLVIALRIATARIACQLDEISTQMAGMSDRLAQLDNHLSS